MGNLSIPNDTLYSSIPFVQPNLTLAGKDGDFIIQGETSRCEAIIRQGKHALIGISPFNSRFSKAYVSSLVLFIAERFSQVDILMPCIDEASRLLIASGVDEKRRLRKQSVSFVVIRNILRLCSYTPLYKTGKLVLFSLVIMRNIQSI
ncbi:tRNA-dependent cyclodipeptide synthase [Vibrio cholerae]|nr:tRNA-dependent cyclodipeptide synthase [Vibrio cholerae]EHV9952459.1 tRNA-dependent cyclodipeptide synthase [Vibrio cholerae]